MNAFSVQLTGPGMGAIAVIGVGGAYASEILAQLVGSDAVRKLSPGRPVRMLLRDPTTQAALDDALLVQTSEAQYELHVHGGTAVVDSVLETLDHAGAPAVSLLEAANHGFFNNLLTAEILSAMPAATTWRSAQLLAAQGTGGLSAWARHWESRMNGSLRSPPLWKFHSAVQTLLDRSYTLGRLLEPPRIAIVGPPNAGKSTLANALLGRPLAITSSLAGTTRDWVDAQATFVDGEEALSVILVDTAGVRSTDDPLEEASIARTHEQADQADVILLVFDGSRAATLPELALGDAYSPSRMVAVVNKIDAGSAGMADLIQRYPHIVQVSAQQNRGTDLLMAAVMAKLDLTRVTSTEPFAFAARQRQILQELALTDDLLRARVLLHALAPDAVIAPA